MTLELNKMYPEDCRETMRKMADNSVDAIVTDPPYGLFFMGKKWDYDVPGVEIWRECFRVLKPGGHLLAFAGTRTQHRMAVNIEDAGFEIRDMIAWVYGSGFPKSLDISKALDKIAGAEREVVGVKPGHESFVNNKSHSLNSGWDRPWASDPEKVKAYHSLTAPATDAAKQWQGWGTALKPALEPITIARKPLTGTVAENVLKWGTGGINVDGCRVDGEAPLPRNAPKKIIRGGKFHAAADAKKEMSYYNPTSGRFPANLIHDGSEEVVRLFPETGPAKASARGGTNPNPMDWGNARSDGSVIKGHNDAGGSAARFFYTAKASASERGKDNTHPTVKPLALMRYLVRLVTPPGGLVYDPFAGSGTTIIAAIEEGFTAIGSDLDPDHCRIFNSRTKHGIQPKMF